MRSVCILQARTSSSRLPGKVLLPIRGIPIVVLAAKRASNTGREVVVVTSTEMSDDGLANLVELYGLRCFRGSLDNVLNRVVSALSSYEENTIVVRLTADNIFPDGAFLDEMESEFLTKNLRYLCSNSPESGLPYGVSVELMFLKDLREANQATNDPYDLEHVTPYLIRRHGISCFEKYRNQEKSQLRCTVDDFSDFCSIQKVFSSVSNPIQEPFINLVALLAKNDTPQVKLIIGSAQMGGSYGINNTSRQLDLNACKRLLKKAILNGVSYIDTARSYGSSEEKIGQSLRNCFDSRLKIITKLSPLLDCPANADVLTLNAFVDASIYQSCFALKREKLDVLMLHRFSHLSDWNGAVWARLIEFRKTGLIEELGVSVQSIDELSHALEIPEISFIQFPYNLLDWRFDNLAQKILEAKLTRNLIIHARSLLLQGLLLSEDEDHWIRANCDSSVEIRDWLLRQVVNCGRKNIADLCIAYVNSMNWIDGLVLGVDNEKQLLENITYFVRPYLSEQQIQGLRLTRPWVSERTLNPALWRKITI